MVRTNFELDKLYGFARSDTAASRRLSDYALR